VLLRRGLEKSVQYLDIASKISSSVVHALFSLLSLSAYNTIQHNKNYYCQCNVVDKALQSIKIILDTTRDPILMEAADHTYEDKYALAEFVTISAISSYLAVLDRFGFDISTLQQTHGILDWVHEQHRSVLLRIQVETSCVFDKEQERKITMAEREVETTSTSSGIMKQVASEAETIKIKKTITEYHWTVGMSCTISLISDDKVVKLTGSPKNKSMTAILYRDQGASETSTSRPRAPLDGTVQVIDLDLTWLLQRIVPSTLDKTEPFELSFGINRTADTCKTPSRNREIEHALAFRDELARWAVQVPKLLISIQDTLSRYATTDASISTGPSLRQVEANHVFVPIVPLFENATVLAKSDLDLFIAHQKHTLDDAITSLSKRYSTEAMVSIEEATLVVLAEHLLQLVERYKCSIAYIERMLEKQLIQAIGTELGAEAFEQFMRFHNQKFFATSYSPKPFSYAVRREKHYPDGMLSIEATNIATNKKEPIQTLVRKVPAGSSTAPIYVPIDVATKVEIRGDRYLHGWMQHVWEDYSPTSCSHLIARAHQFSSFLVVIGVMGGPDTFLPKEAIVVQNKDEVMIPLEMTVLPSAKEFKDAIVSLSPEQRAFAQAFRSMQLESSVFGVCIIQLKPQLERLLELPSGALTKEIQLTQDLMSLFVQYQIPSDLLSFDGSEEASVKEKVAIVAGHVQAVLDVIDKAKVTQLEEEKRRADVRKMRANANTVQEMMYTSGIMSGGQETLQDFTMAYSGIHMADSAPLMGQIPPMQQMQQMHASDTSSRQSSRSRRRLSLEEVEDVTGDDTADRANSPHQSSSQTTSSANDFTLIPKMLDAKLEIYDKDGSLRSTLIRAGTQWDRRRQDTILLPSVISSLEESEIESEKTKAMALLTAISRSGALPIDASELHVVVAVSHRFENDIMSTVIKENVNPIEKVEASLLLIASTIHNAPSSVLIAAKDSESLLAGPQGSKH
jgi:hypothetical protein